MMRQLPTAAILVLATALSSANAQVTLSKTSVTWQENFTVTFCMSSTQSLPAGSQLDLRLGLPYEDSGGSGCVPWFNGTASSICTSNYVFNFIFGNPQKQQFSLQLNGGNVPSSSYSLTISSDNPSSPKFAQLSLLIATTTSINTSCAVRAIYTPFPREATVANYAGRNAAFTSRLAIRNPATAAPVSASSEISATLTILGPRLQLTSSATIASVESGDTSVITIRYKRHPTASSDAASVNITIAVSTAEATVNSVSGLSELSPGFPGAYRLLNGAATSTEATAGTISLTFNDNLQVGKAYIIDYSASYFANPTDGTTYEASGTLQVITARSPFSPSTAPLTFNRSPLQMAYGEERTAQLSLTVPKGAMDLVISAQFSSNNLSPVPGRIVSLSCSASGNGTVSPASATETDMTLRSGRVRRAVTDFSTAATPVIAIRNPATAIGDSTVVINFAIGPGSGVEIDNNGLLNVFLTMSYSGLTYVLDTETYSIVRPVLTITNSLVSSEPSNRLSRKYAFTTKLSHTVNSTIPAHTLEINLNTIGMRTTSAANVTYTFGNGTAISQPATSFAASVIFQAPASLEPLSTDTTVVMETAVEVIDFEYFNVGSPTYRRATVFYYSADNASSSRQRYASICLNCNDCIVRQDENIGSTGSPPGIAVLLFFIGLLIGALLALLLLLLWYLCLRCRSKDSDSERLMDENDAEAINSANDQLILAPVPGGKEFNFDDLHPIKKDDSILMAMDNDTTTQVNRDLDAMDVSAARSADQQLEEEFDDYRVLGCELTVQLLVNSNAISDLRGRQLETKFRQTAQAELKAISESEAKIRQEILDKLMKCNRDAMIALLNAHRKRRNEKQKELKRMGCEKEFVDSYLDILDQQFRVEREDKIRQLRLEQEEQLERNRQEFAERKRKAIGQQASMVEQELRDSDLPEDQLQWYLQQHQRVQQRVDELHDKELARQRLLLEEKLQRRRMHAGDNEVRQDQETELLNTLARQMMSMVKQLNKEDEITPEKMEACLERIREQLAKCREAFDEEKRQQRKALAQERSRRKANLLKDFDEKSARKFERVRARAEAQATESSSSTQVDPVSCIEGLAKKRSAIREEREQLEEQLDEEDMQVFEEKMDEVTAKAKENVLQFKEELVDELKEADAEPKEINKLLRKHNKQLRQLQQEQEQQRQEQQQELSDNVRKRREALQRKLSEDQRDNQELRDKEQSVVQEMLNQQLSMSEEERDRILREHERNVSQLDQNLTSSRIRQQKLLDEAYARRKQESLNRLKQQHSAEAKSQERRMGQVDSDDEDGDTPEQLQEKKLGMMLKQEKSKLVVMQGEEISLEEEMESVKVQMLKERSLQLQQQEERLAAVIAKLQMDKAKEMAKIEEQQQAISQLKVSLMDDLSERRILSDDRCKEILEDHEDQLERLLEKKEKERKRQQRKMTQAMQDRIAKKQEQLIQEQEQAVEEAVSDLDQRDRVTAQFRRAMIIQKHQLQAEKFRKQLEREMDQQLQESRLKHQQRIQEILQQEEFKFIGMLASLGKFNADQLLQIVSSLFPARKRSDLEQMVKQMLVDQDRKKTTDKRLSKEEDEEGQERTQRLVEKNLKFRNAMMKEAVDVLFAVQRFKSQMKREQQNDAYRSESQDEYLSPIDSADYDESGQKQKKKKGKKLGKSNRVHEVDDTILENEVL